MEGTQRARTSESMAPQPLASRSASTLASVPSLAVLLVALVMPAACVVFTVVFFEERENEDSVFNIWTRETSSLYKDEEYRYETCCAGDESQAELLAYSSFSVIARRHDGGDILQADIWKEIEARFSEVQNSTKVTVDGVEFGFQDFCYNQQPYYLPCVRFTLLDCFAEGGYDLPETTAAFWRDTVTGVVRAGIPTLRAAVVDQALATPPLGSCAGQCTLDGSHPALAMLTPGGPVGTWPADPICSACLAQVRNSSGFQVIEELLYYNALTALASTLAYLAPANLQPYIMSLTAADSAQWDAVVDQLLMAVTGIEGQTPYTCDKITEHMTCNPPTGGPRPQLQNSSGTYLSPEEMRRTLSGTCYNWDQGQLLPSYNKYLYYGGVEPSIEAEFITSMKAMSSLFLLASPGMTKQRVGTDLLRPGGNFNITDDCAERALDSFKKEFEAAFSRGWDDTSQRMRFTAFSDDVGAGGTFRTAMTEMNKESGMAQLVFYCFMPFLSAIVFIQCFKNPAVESRTVLSFVANIVVCLGVFAALGVTVKVGYRINIVHYGILPFLLVGLGLDDAYIVIMAADNAGGATAEERFMRAVLRVINPVMMTSCVNAIQFLVIWIVCDVGALYKVALTGFVACGIQCLNIITCVMPLLLLDLRRSHAGRCDVLCCLRRSAASDEKTTSCTYYDVFYKRLLSSLVGKVVVMVLALALIVVACVRLGDLPVGLSLEDFFSPNTQAAAFSADRAEFFPTWPVAIYWGEIDYFDPTVQIKMASQFEKVQTSEYVTSGLPTTFVWTAALAQWAIPSAFQVPNTPCNANNLLTGGNCGETHGCESTFVENTVGLLLVETSNNIGFCYRGETLINSLAPGDPRAAQFVNTTEYCPTFQWNTTDFSRCYMSWTATRSFQIANPDIRMGADGPELPIKLSLVRGNSVFFTYGTFTSDDYVNLIEETRAHVDDNENLHSWMTGNAYFFWEQYVDIIEFTFIAGAWSVGCGTLCSFLFLLIELSTQHVGVPWTRKLAIALLSALLIAAMSSIAMLTVIGVCGWFGINFSVFTSSSCVFSTGFTVEYVAHIVHYYAEATGDTAVKRIQSTMRRLAWPTFIAFLSTLISLCMLLVINVKFMTVYFFGPLCISCLVTFFFGVIFLPSVMGFASCFPTLRARAKDAPISSDGAGDGDGDGDGEQQFSI